MPRRDLMLTDKIALLEQIKNQPPNTSDIWSAKIYICTFYTAAGETAS
jgi:hypothetical protein